MDKVKDLLHGGHKKEEHVTPTGTAAPHSSAAPVGGAGYGQPGIAQTTGTHPEGAHEKKGMFGGLGGHKDKKESGDGKKGGFLGIGGGSSSSSSSSSDEEREGATERNRLRRQKRERKKLGGGGVVHTGAAGTTGSTVPVEGEKKKHGFFG